jgi:hypothetical protein
VRGLVLADTKPAADTQVAEQRFSMMQHVGDDQPSVVVLHDDPRALALLRRYIEGYQFVLARTPQRAQQALQRKPPIAVLADAAWLDRQPQALDELQLPETMPRLVELLRVSNRELTIRRRARNDLGEPLVKARRQPWSADGGWDRDG